MPNKKKVGLHLDNKEPIDQQTRGYLVAMDPNVILVTGSIGDADLDWLASTFPNAVIIVRVVYQRGMSHDGYLGATYTLWLRATKRWPARQVIIQLYNEPQFDFEGFGQTPDDIKSFHDHWLWGFTWIKGQPYGNLAQFGFTPMAPGNKDIPVIEDPPGTVTYLEYCQDLIAMCEFVFLHIYAEWPEQVLDPWYGGRIQQYKKWTQGKPIYITETAMAVKRQDLRGDLTVQWFKTYIQPDDEVLGATQWLGNIPGNWRQDLSFDDNRHFEPTGLPRPVHDAILAYLAEPSPEPPQPEPVEVTPVDVPAEIYDLITQKAAIIGIDRQLAFATGYLESGFNPNAYREEPGISPVYGWESDADIVTDGSLGIGQILRSTAKGWGVCGDASLYNVATNIDLMCRIIAANLEAWPDLESAIAAYNAGGGQVGTYGWTVVQGYVEKVKALMGRTYMREGGEMVDVLKAPTPQGWTQYGPTVGEALQTLKGISDLHADNLAYLEDMVAAARGGLPLRPKA